jgi:hypothetical protein
MLTSTDKTIDHNPEFAFHKEWVEPKHVLEVAIIVAPSRSSVSSYARPARDGPPPAKKRQSNEDLSVRGEFMDPEFAFHKEWVEPKHVLEVAIIVAPSSRSIQIQVEEERGLISIYGQGEISYTADNSQLPMDCDSKGAREWVEPKHVLEVAIIVAPSSRSIQIQVSEFVDVNIYPTLLSSRQFTTKLCFQLRSTGS